jgi:Uncharacterized protein conserved in bacteria
MKKNETQKKTVAAEHHNHAHTHDPKEIRAIINSISRTSGHLNSIKGMLENGQDCSDVLIQLAAVKGELNKIGKVILEEHIEHCIVEAAAEGDTEAIKKMNKAINQFIK